MHNSGGAFFVDYLWMKKEHLDAGLREALLERVEEDVLEAGEDCYNLRIGLRDRLYGEFFISFGFDELNQLEITKHLKEAPRRKFSAQDVDVFGYKSRSVILWTPESKTISVRKHGRKEIGLMTIKELAKTIQDGTRC